MARFNRSVFYKYLVALLCGMLLASLANAAPKPGEMPSPTTYRLVKYVVGEWVKLSEDEGDLNSGPFKLEWQYPVFTGQDPARVEKLNRWLRRQSLEALLSVQEAAWDTLERSSDADLLHRLAHDRSLREWASVEAEMVPMHAFGPYMFFLLRASEARGTSPTTFKNLVFHYRDGHAVSMESLFKPGAEQALARNMYEEVEAESRREQAAYAACIRQRKRSPQAERCPEPPEDSSMSSCSTSFAWEYFQINAWGNFGVQWPIGGGTSGRCASLSLDRRKARLWLVDPRAFDKATPFIEQAR